MPSWIKKGNLDFKRSFIQSLFDDEGSVSINSKEISLLMHKDKHLIDNLEMFFLQIREILEELGIVGVTIRKGRGWKSKLGTSLSRIISICGLSNHINFRDNVNFIHLNKRKRLLQMIKSSIDFKLKKHRTKIKIIELLKENGKLNTSELSRRIGKSRRIIRDRLDELEKLQVVDRIRVQDKTKPHIWFLNKPENFNPLS